MTAYTVLNISEMETITAQYAIPKVNSFQVLSGGSENTNYVLVTEKAKYVLTICEQKSLQEANDLALLLEHLAAHQFSTSILIRSIREEAITIWQQKPVMLKAFLEGQVIQDLPAHLLIYIGKELGQLHQIKAPEYLPKTINYGMDYFDEVNRYAPNSPFHAWLQEVKKKVQKHLATDLPKALIHSDVFYSNIIVSADQNSATIMDFEEAAYYYRIFDLGMMMVGLCSKGKTLELHKVHSLLKGYQQEIELLEVEQKALQTFIVYAAAAMSFWRHKNFNYTKPTPALKDHYLALKHIADSVREWPKDAFK